MLRHQTFEPSSPVRATARSNFYVVDSGEYSVLIKQKGYAPVHYYQQGDCFGELALMYGTPRTATVRAQTECKLWQIPRSRYRAIEVRGRVR